MSSVADKALDLLANSMWEKYSLSIFDYIKKLEERINQLERDKQKAYLRQKEIFQEFGIGHATLKNWVACGLNEIRVENRVYYDRQDIQAYLNKHK
ncbi:hypothetical protein HZY88_01225 [Aerococcaceae bacterium DSM 111176]|nr:hypothetical protein [Aerococcaceae bacterium DSM 111176]